MEALKYTKDGCTYCCGCNESSLMLNQFGYCADCFGKLDDATIKRLTGYIPVVTTVTETKYYPSPGWFKVALVAAAIVGAINAGIRFILK